MQQSWATHILLGIVDQYIQDMEEDGDFSELSEDELVEDFITYIKITRENEKEIEKERIAREAEKE